MHYILPDEDYKKLKKWVSIFSYKGKYEVSYKQVHDKIKHNFFQGGEKEIEILKEVLLSDIISRENLWDYFWNFEKIKSESDIEKEKLAKRKQLEEEKRIAEENERIRLEKEKVSKIKQKQEEEKKRMIKFKKEQEEKKRRVNNLLNEGFKKDNTLYDADKEYQDICSQSEYEKLKAKHIQKYFEDEFVKKGVIKHAPDAEQAESIGALGDKVLVSARAGSGKTQTIAGKVALLVNKYGVKEKEILVLCFNKSAAENMKKRIQKYVDNFNNARTFHSWAMKILFNKNDYLQGEKNILIDEKGVKSNNNLENYICKILEENKGDLKAELYEFLKQSNFSFVIKDKNLKIYKNKAYKNVKNHKKEKQFYPTLSGQNVRSLGEKWISDFLFENGFFLTNRKNEDPLSWYYEDPYIGSFAYEKYLKWKIYSDKESWNPDFTISQGGKIAIWEHWAIRKNSSGNNEFLFDNYEEGYNDKIRKIKKYDIDIIETFESDIPSFNFKNHDEINYSRKGFEKILKENLEKKGFSLPTEEEKLLIKEKLIDAVWDKQKKKGFKNFITFINLLQQKNWGDSWEEKINRDMDFQPQHVQQFIRLGIKVAKLYLKSIKKDKILDFNTMLQQSILKIENGESGVENIKYILIDEFQDFSPLFQGLIDAIVENNSLNGSEINLFCVGDYCQLINGFSGSDISLFEEFKKDANSKVITTCYRSFEDIVDRGNTFAKKVGLIKNHEYEKEKSKASNTYLGKNQKEELKVYFSGYIENQNNELNIFKINGKYSDEYVVERQMYRCFELIKQHSHNKSVLILSRNNDIGYHVSQEDFLNTLYKNSKNDIANFNLLKIKNLEDINSEENKDKKFLSISTMHKSKGLEADIVILLDITEKTIPSIHPSNELFEIFGRTPEKILAEEKRLFYVALTRAKEKLFILTEAGNESEFLHAL